ncbi:MAG: trehalose-phosphatase, partial [Candidatus Eisenbacteria bacterium]
APAAASRPETAMQVLRTSTDPDAFFSSLRRAARRVLFLDYDGTLAPFRVERGEAVPYEGLRPRLRTLIGSGRSRVVVVSGRWTRDVLPLLGLPQTPEIWGCHGWERLRPPDPAEIGFIGEEAVRGLVEADEWAQKEGLQRRCERKPASVAVHWRGLPPDEVGVLKDKVLSRWKRISAKAGLSTHAFDGGLELRAPGRDKGTAVRTVLSEEPAGSPAAYLGDDRTDEDAFLALEGRGLRVLVREELRPTEADLWLRPPGELLAFLDRWIDATKGEPAE